MTPEEAEVIHYAAAQASYSKDAELKRPRDHRRAGRAGWQAVLDAVQREIDREWAGKIVGTFSVQDADSSPLDAPGRDSKAS